MKHCNVSGPIIKEYAKSVVQELLKTEFRASNGWLACFLQKISDSL